MRSFLSTRQRVDLLACVLLNQVSLLLPRGTERDFIDSGYEAVDRHFLNYPPDDACRDPVQELRRITRAMTFVSDQCQSWLQQHPTGAGGSN